MSDSASFKLAGRLAAMGTMALVALHPAHPAVAAPDAKGTPADLVLTGGKIYTLDPARSTAAALAVKNGKAVFVGSAADARRWIGPSTKTEQLGGRLVLPGLIDTHVLGTWFQGKRVYAAAAH